VAGPREDVRTRDGRPAGPADARERILLTAYDLFRRHGLGRVGVDRIIAEAGVAKTTLYRHFRSKDELMQAVLAHHEQIWIWDWLAVQAEPGKRTPEQQVLAIFDAFEDWFAQASYEGCLFTNVLLELHDPASHVRQRSVAALTTVKGLVEDLAEGVGAHEPREFAQQIQTLMWGAIVAKLNGYPEPAQQARRIAVLMLDNEHAARTGDA
jgi:AcrR family transcriptional regulator